ncbi:MAG: ABC transporter permease [Actinobacteria bacterium]|nr:ABC transporter permease [Actinomycetota bacterium]
MASDTVNSTLPEGSPPPYDPRGAGSGSAGESVRKALLTGVSRYGLIGVWAIVIVVFSILRPDTFPTTANLQNILGTQAVLLVLALALVAPLMAGDFDLSVAFVMAFSSIMVAKLNVDQHWPILVAMLAALVAAFLIGTVNGLLIVGLGIDSFIVTLGVGTLVFGFTEWISNAQTISGVSPHLVEWVLTNRILGISMSFWYGLLLCFILWFLFQYTPLGRRFLFVGFNRNVSRLTGLRVDRLRIGALISSSVIAAIAGILYVGSQGGVEPTAGQSFLLPAFAATYLGATTILPGRFNAWGTFVAVYFLVTGITGLQLLGVQNFVQNLFYGAALVIAVALPRIFNRRRASEEAAAGT